MPRGSWQSALGRGSWFALVWWILVEGAASSWWIGIPAVLLATVTSIAMLGPVHLVWYRLPEFLIFFLTRSMLGGIDVAWRALHPRLPIAPDLLVYPLQLPSGFPQVFMANTVSMLPGTLSAELDHDVLKVHVLNGRKDALPGLQMLEQKVIALFGNPLSAYPKVE